MYVKKTNSETDITALWWTAVWSWFIKINTKFRGKWDFISGVCLWELKNKALILLVNPERDPQGCLLKQECENAEFVWKLKRAFEKAAVSTAVCLQESFQVTVLKRVNYRAELFKAGLRQPRVSARFEFRFESLKSSSVLILLVYQLMIFGSKNNGEMIRENAFEHKKTNAG